MLEVLMMTNLEFCQGSLMWLQIMAAGAYPQLQHISAWLSDNTGKQRHEEEQKSKGGGTAVLVNNRWCNTGHATVEYHFCSPDVAK